MNLHISYLNNKSLIEHPLTVGLIGIINFYIWARDSGIEVPFLTNSPHLHFKTPEKTTTTIEEDSEDEINEDSDEEKTKQSQEHASFQRAKVEKEAACKFVF